MMNYPIRRLLVFAVLTAVAEAGMPPSMAWAGATRIQLRVDYTNYRVRPQPRFNRNHINFVFTLNEDGTVQQEFHDAGRHARKGKSDTKLGERFHVIDQNTIQRKIDHKDHIQTITISVSGKSCRATMTNELKPGFTEWEGNSTQLGTKAYYRDWKMVSATCSIK